MQIEDEAITQEGGTAPVGAPIRVQRALISVSDKTGVIDFARGTARARCRAPLDRRDGGGAPRGGHRGHRRRRVHRLAGDPRRPGQDAASRGCTPRCSPGATTPSTCRRSRRGDRADRPGLREPLSVRGDGRSGRGDRGRGGREHRHRRPDDDPRRGEEPRRGRRGGEARELRRGARRSCSDSGGEISAETRHWLANEAFAQIANYDAAISRWFGLRYEVFPSHFTMSYEKFLDLSYGENPHQKAALYVESPAQGAHPHGRRQASRQGAVVQQRARPRLRAAAARRVRRAGVRDRQAQQPLRRGRRRVGLRGLREGLRLRPALGLRRRARLQPPDRRGAGRAPIAAVHRGAAGARLRGGRARDPHAQGVDPDPRRRRTSPTSRASATSSGCAAVCWRRTPTGSRRRARR